MPVLSKPYHSALPDELEREVFLLASREQHELANYVLVARRVAQWLRPILYRKISISCEPKAEHLIHSLEPGHKHEVFCLCIGVSIRPCTTVRLLQLCPRLVSLTLCAQDNGFSRYRKVRQAINSLRHLKYISVNPAVLFKTNFVHLPNFTALHRVTHLDLSVNWDWEVITRGFQFLYHLTHLSITWKISRNATDALRALLRREDFKILVLWTGDTETLGEVVADLVEHRLNDPRTVLLHRTSFWTLRAEATLWLEAARIIAWRNKNNITMVQHSLNSEQIP